MRMHLRALVAGVMLLGPPVAASAGAQTAPLTEGKARAAFVLNVARFVRWPEPTGPLVIAVAGDETLATALAQAVSGRVIDGRVFSVRSLGAADDPGDCDVLYFGNLNDLEASALLARTRGQVLTVGATPRFLRDGGIIRIFIEGDRLRFQVNRGRATEVGLEISSQLLKLAVQ